MRVSSFRIFLCVLWAKWPVPSGAEDSKKGVDTLLWVLEQEAEGRALVVSTQEPVGAWTQGAGSGRT